MGMETGSVRAGRRGRAAGSCPTSFPTFLPIIYIIILGDATLCYVRYVRRIPLGEGSGVEAPLAQSRGRAPAPCGERDPRAAARRRKARKPLKSSPTGRPWRGESPASPAPGPTRDYGQRLGRPRSPSHPHGLSLSPSLENRKISCNPRARGREPPVNLSPWAEPLVPRAAAQPRHTRRGLRGLGQEGPPQPCHRLSQRWSIPATRGPSREERDGRPAGAGGDKAPRPPGDAPSALSLQPRRCRRVFALCSATPVRGRVAAPRPLLMSKGPRDSDVTHPPVTSRFLGRPRGAQRGSRVGRGPRHPGLCPSVTPGPHVFRALRDALHVASGSGVGVFIIIPVVIIVVIVIIIVVFVVVVTTKRWSPRGARPTVAAPGTFCSSLPRLGFCRGSPSRRYRDIAALPVLFTPRRN